MSELEHPFKTEVQAIRVSILGAAPGIAEGIKWKAPSVRFTSQSDFRSKKAAFENLIRAWVRHV